MRYEIIRVDMTPGNGQAERPTGIKSTNIDWIESEVNRLNTTSRLRGDYYLYEVESTEEALI